MPTRALIVLAAVLFACTVLVRAPAAWLLAAAPPAFECRQPSGSMWRGTCGQLQIPGIVLNDVGWKLQAWPLLRARVDLAVRSDDVRAPGTGTVSLQSGGRLTVRDLRADLPVDSGFLPLFPAGWSGQLQLALTAAEFRGGRLKSLQGTVIARSLAQRRPAMPFGSYELRFAPVPAGSTAQRDRITGALRDLGGPLIVSGTLSVRNDSEYELSGLVATRPEASAELARAVEFLGPAEATGRRRFALTGTF